MADKRLTEMLNDLKETQPADSGDKVGKTFTQEDVDRIVRDRLARERATPKMAGPSEEDLQRAAELEKREADLQEKEAAYSKRDADLISRESRNSCREYLFEQGYPSVLLDVIDTSNPSEFRRKAELIACAAHLRKPAPPLMAEPPLKIKNHNWSSEAIKHKPKQHFDPYDPTEDPNI